MHAAVFDFGTWGSDNTLAADPRSPALQPCPEQSNDKLHQPMALELPLPLTEAVVAKALAELSQGAATALESCLECYRSKRMSSADLLSFASSTSIHSASLAAVFKAQDADAQDMGEAAGADDMAELMSLLRSGPAPRHAPQPPTQQTKQQPVAGHSSIASIVSSKLDSEIVNINAAVAALNSASCPSIEPCARPQTAASSAAGRGPPQLNLTTVTPAHTAVAASTAAAAWSARTFSQFPALSPILEETPDRRVKWAPVIAATRIIIDDLATPKCGVVRKVPAVTLSCLQAVCDAANAGCVGRHPATTAVLGKAEETLERTESALSSADTPTARAAPAWEHCDADLSSAATVIIPAPVARGTLTLKASAGHAGSKRAECAIENRMLTLKIDSVVVVEMPLKNLAVGLQQGCDNMFTIATVHKNKIYDEICCFADVKAKRDEWISIFWGMGVVTFDSGARYKREKK